VHILLEYEKLLEQEQEQGYADVLQTAPHKIFMEEGGQALVFLSLFVIPLLDTNKDNFVDRSELFGFQVSCMCTSG